MTVVTHEIRGYTLGFDHLQTPPVTRYETIKSLFDIPAAIVLLVVTAPVVLLAMMVVRLTSRGPAIYTQKRLGYGGRVFTIFKIRTMYLGSEPNGARWSLPGDPRITPWVDYCAGATSMSCPSSSTCVRGEMSLIGPRPERPEIVVQLEKSLPEYRLRLLVRPGVTGLAQVLQPPDTDLNSVRRKLNFDIYYISRMSLWLDLRIMIGTALHLMSVSERVIRRALAASRRTSATSSRLTDHEAIGHRAISGSRLGRMGERSRTHRFVPRHSGRRSSWPGTMPLGLGFRSTHLTNHSPVIARANDQAPVDSLFTSRIRRSIHLVRSASPAHVRHGPWDVPVFSYDWLSWTSAGERAMCVVSALTGEPSRSRP